MSAQTKIMNELIKINHYNMCYWLNIFVNENLCVSKNSGWKQIISGDKCFA